MNDIRVVKLKKKKKVHKGRTNRWGLNTCFICMTALAPVFLKCTQPHICVSIHALHLNITVHQVLAKRYLVELTCRELLRVSFFTPLIWNNHYVRKKSSLMIIRSKAKMNEPVSTLLIDAFEGVISNGSWGCVLFKNKHHYCACVQLFLLSQYPCTTQSKNDTTNSI